MGERYEVFDDGTLRCTVSNRLEDARDSMLRFVKEHIVKVLHPINEHIDSLYKQFQQVQGAFTKTNECVRSLSERLDGRIRENEVLEGKFKNLELSLEDVRRGLRESNYIRRIESLEIELARKQKAMNETDRRVDLLGTSLQVLEKKFDESNASVHALELKHWQIDAATRALETKFGHVEDLASGDLISTIAKLQEESTAFWRSLQKVTYAHNKTRDTMNKFHEEIDIHQKQMKSSTRDLDERSKALHAMHENINEMVLRHETTLEEEVQNIAVLKSKIGGMMQELHQLEEEEHKNEEEVHKLQATIAGNEARLQTSLTERMKDVEGHVTKIREWMPGAQETLDNHTKSVEYLQKTVKAHDTSLRHQQYVVQSLQTSSINQLARISDVEGRVGQTETIQAELTQKQTNAQETIHQLIDSTKTAEVKIDDHRIELEKMEAFSSATRQALGKTNAVVHGLHVDLGSAKNELSTTAMRLDLAHEHLGGLCSGLKDTHKLALVGQDGMLVPRSVRDKTQPLPVLETWGRPASAQRTKNSPRVASAF